MTETTTAQQADTTDASFADLGLKQPLLDALVDAGYKAPTPIQRVAIPVVLTGRDVIGLAQTGTGKTAGFTLPIIDRLIGGPKRSRVLILTPTRELCVQVEESFEKYSKYAPIDAVAVYGGVKYDVQEKALRSGVDAVVATPGRLLDHLEKRNVDFEFLETLVLDEADRMLDMGFIHDIKKIIAKLPTERQSLFFSATMAKEIVELAGKILSGSPERVTIEPKKTTAEKVEQAVYFVQKNDKPKLLIHILEANPNSSTLVFSRTKHGADKIVRVLQRANINAAAIHGNKSQNQRQKALNDFKDGKLGILIATDIAARGIDVEELALVINYDLPNVPETYVHRIGRTGRAKASGIALSFCNGEEKAYLKDIQKLISQTIPVIDEHPFPDDGTEVFEKPKQQQRGRGDRTQRGNAGNSGNNKGKRMGAPRRN